MKSCTRKLACFLALLLSACASPPVHLFALERASRGEPTFRADVPTVIVGPLTLPELVDRPQIVVREGDFAVHASEQERWASPLKESLTRMLSATLNHEAPARRFVPIFGADKHGESARLTVDISTLDLARSKGAILIAHWTYLDPINARNDLDGESTAQAGIAMEGYTGLVDALNRAAESVAIDMAQQLKARWQNP